MICNTCGRHYFSTQSRKALAVVHAAKAAS